MSGRPLRWSAVAYGWVLSGLVCLAGCSAASLGSDRSLDNRTPEGQAQADERVNLRLQLASAYWQRGQFSVAMAEAQQALNIDPGNVDALQIVALSHWSLGDRSRAGEVFHRALEIAPKQSALQRNVAWFQCAGPHWSDGAQMLEQVQQLEDTPRLSIMRAQCVAPHDVVASAEAFQLARQRWPDDEVVARIWAEHQWRAGDHHRLIEQLTALNQGRFASERTQALQASAQQALESLGATHRQHTKESLDD